MEIKNVALIVHACDRYQFLYKGFAYFFSKHWDYSINCNYYFATEQINVAIPNFTNIKSGEGQWADRLKILLQEKIKEEYVLYFQEDMWLNKKVNKNFFNDLFAQAIKNNWKQIKLHSSEVYCTEQTPYFSEGFNIAQLNNAKSDYLMSHQVTLWKKDFLIDQLYKNEHPWRNERRGTKRLKKINPAIFHADYFAENGKKEINQNENIIGRSEYQTISVNGILNNNIQPFITELQMGNPEEQAYAKELEYHFENSLTHDGKPKPRKEDLFKKIKKWFKTTD